jgi:hypothetical protein
MGLFYLEFNRQHPRLSKGTTHLFVLFGAEVEAHVQKITAFSTGGQEQHKSGSCRR